MPKKQKFETQWAGKTLSIEVGEYANQANGSCLVQYGNTVVLATAVMSEDKREGLDFFPLMTEYEERLYAAGRIKGSRFIKKEGRPTDEAVLIARYIDRAIRPLFDERIRNDVQVIVTCLAFDGENDPDVIGLIAASCALHISDIPWNGPIANIRVAQLDGQFIMNPSYTQREQSILDLSFAGTPETIIMVEAGCKEAPEDLVLSAFWAGQKELGEPIALINKVQASVGREKRDMITPKNEAEKLLNQRREKIENLARPFIVKKVQELFYKTPQATKAERGKQKMALKLSVKEFLLEQGIEEKETKFGTEIALEELEAEVVRQILDHEKRIDGRTITQIRPLVAEVEKLPRVHGSGHFMRGETQVLSVVTLGSPRDEQTLDSMETVGTQRYFHHYNFPPYSVGEVKPLRGASRRDIGHGALAEKAIRPMLPEKEQFPYTIRVVSEVFGSNGSSSMASTCGSSLALMDAGVPLKRAVAGVAMGLASDANGNWKVLTDIQDLEDGKGGMDFKITGSTEGITAIQMDTKTTGLSREIVEQTFSQSKEARKQILDVMSQTISASRPELSPYAPRITSLRINPERIGDVIGPGGKMINEIIDTTGVASIDIEDDGLVMITSVDAKGAQEAEEWIKKITKEIVPGEIYEGKVVRVMDFGVIVEFLPKKDGMVHISNMAPWRVEKVTDITKLGDKVLVKIMEVDPSGKISLSMKDAPGNTYPERPVPSKTTDKPSGFRKPFRKPLKSERKDG
ncbi:MAG: Polyribonucleotide nucleotidyltransferase [Candidatus Uhrbacteria bacterium GW2011_GWE2_40_58]|nr:MAG: Polyribonucleotide nucleotidyltransferase [Candidatus Uhrbacteria bacterium GW2011_GWF2_40_263]KKR67444.1 MAG: Polyribonucleotide nucleotidyltransferase [Candidatus Uhrbacteria bacterium GW2011_GWE2_40_58]OGL94451.1 MAG: polyribonucleotide nucleotidyltransferase [Candidatus Uhrbacteria bacterium RIFOXYA2_FULL_40_9]OGL98283.1 MAG: polyribonucleotide nucleotidyltransferase [Candidatus Uhrbacteria bacterium RIFOXYB2_FULL_41_18]HCB55695.1 polyribonucleotide nucleotidyltransferase [Candidatu